jgi:hypothetical protein
VRIKEMNLSLKTLYRVLNDDNGHRLLLVRDTVFADPDGKVPAVVQWPDGKHYVELLTENGWVLKEEGFSFAHARHEGLTAEWLAKKLDANA